MPTTLALIAAGKHVFCEKPLAPSYPDALDMTEAAEGAGLVNMVNLTYRNSPALQKAREHGRGRRDRRAAPRRGRATCRAGWSARPGATGGPRTNGCGGCRRSTARPACSAMSASTSSISPTYGAADDDRRASRPIWRPSPRPRATASATMCSTPMTAWRSTARLESGALATIVATRFATGHANDLVAVAARHQGRAQGRDRRPASRRCRPASARTSTRTAGRSRTPAGQAQRPALRRCADVRRERRSVVPPRRRNPAPDRRGLRECNQRHAGGCALNAATGAQSEETVLARSLGVD